MSRFKSRLIELGLTLAPLLSCACGTDTADGGGAGAPATGKGGTGGSGGATGGSGGTTGGSGGATGGSGGATGGSGGATGGAGGGGTGGSGGSSGGGTGGGGGSGGVLPFELTSPAFEHNEECAMDNLDPCNVFPQENLLDSFMGGGNVSPELNWGPGPAGTMSYAIVLHDYSNGFTHWAIWNIPAAVTQLPEDLPREANPATPAGAQQVSFEEQDPGYQGPGAADHVYEFRLYALDTATFSPGGADPGAVRGDLEGGADGAVLDTTDLRGKSTP